MPVPHLAFMMPGRMLNASLSHSSSQDVVGLTLGIWETLLCCCSLTCSRMVCCLSSRVDNHLISLDWALISSVCQRCKCDKTDTCIWWAISSSTISARKASWPLRAWASAESCKSEALLRASSSCNQWALVTFCLIPSLILLRASACMALDCLRLSSILLGFMLSDIQKMAH